MNSKAFFFRALHVVLGLYLLFILGYVYICGLSGRRDGLLWIAVASLAFEGLVLLFWGGRCPVSLVQEKYGDDKGFFGLFLPRKAWPWVVPCLSAVSGLGILLVFLNG
ncbi:MAG: hypothetical protein ACYS47_20115 [Planctomycetota bacterium]|jgi:hypothetical protein